MDDLVARLREHYTAWGSPQDRDAEVNEGVMAFDCNTAADEIERLRAENAALRADAERYQWLREQVKFDGETSEWDEVVDFDKKGRKIVETKKETFWTFTIKDDWRLCCRQDDAPTLDAVIDAARKAPPKPK